MPMPRANIPRSDAESQTVNFSPGPDERRIMPDPLRELFGRETKMGFLAVNENDDIPDELVAVLDANGLGGRKFSIILKEIGKGESNNDPARAHYIKSYNSTHIPTPDYIAENYGPGQYVMLVQWYDKDSEGKRKARTEPIHVQISEKRAGDYRKNQLEKRIAAAKEEQDRVREAVIENKLSSASGDFSGLALPGMAAGSDPMQGVVGQIEKTLELARMLGWDKPGVVQHTPSFDIEKLMGIVVTVGIPLMKLFLDKRENDKLNAVNQTEKLYTMMMEMMKIQNGSGAASNAVREYKEMISGVLDLKKTVEGNRETVADRIFDLVEGVAPKLLEYAAMTQAARARDPIFGIASSAMAANPDIQALKSDPGIRAEVVARLDYSFGWEQTDAILSVAGVARPEQCPHEPTLQYPLEDPRRQNSTVEVEEGGENDA